MGASAHYQVVPQDYARMRGRHPSETAKSLLSVSRIDVQGIMTHGQLVRVAEKWLRQQGCWIVLSEQTADSGEIPDAIGWRPDSHSVVIECKVSRSDFTADQQKRVRQKPRSAMGCERLYLAPAGLLTPEAIPDGWGFLEVRKGEVEIISRSRTRSQRTEQGLVTEMRFLLASLRRVEVRIEPQTITEFLKWKHRMAAYNGGQLPKGLVPLEQELSSSFEGPR